MKLKVDGKYNITTTVDELIKKLKEFDGNMLVYSEGCDCWGNIVNVVVSEENTVLIERDDNAMESSVKRGGKIVFEVAEKYKGRLI